ncbi:hypothetical protein [Pseudohongiella sp.]|uniref:hypothetical protein n=1 Tax=Pseudohongiella sp. TaxID=1979412 RepID=UPI001834D6A1|nr:hypothetical protein [Pseudohongiella sp.]HDZ09413.1 hypothetical protein [Pseudohongiella sp.]HEA63332.1 hypothetical protein [Pseudohongiella sp.]
MSDIKQSKPTPDAKEREYEKSGLYPENEKPFRILALLGWLGVVVVCLAGAAAILDMILL